MHIVTMVVIFRLLKGNAKGDLIQLERIVIPLDICPVCRYTDCRRLLNVNVSCVIYSSIIIHLCFFFHCAALVDGYGWINHDFDTGNLYSS